MPRPLRIGIDAHAIGERKTGNERFVADVIRELRERCSHELFLYFTRGEAAAAWRSHGDTVRVMRPAHPLLRIPVSLPLLARRDRLDVLLVQYAGPPVCSCPVVTVVHDVSFARHPEFFSRYDRVWMPRAVPFTMRHAAEVVTVSEFSREEIIDVYGIPSDRITVASRWVSPLFLDSRPRPSPVDPPYFLFIGNLQPRKNVLTLLRGYRQLVEHRPQMREKLVVAGQPWYAAESLREGDDLRRGGRLIFPGYVSDDALVGLLQGATAFAFPSLYEGFGLPVLEAMAVGTPTVVSDIAAMREVAGHAALLVPPLDPVSWAQALRRVATEPDLRKGLVEAGKERLALFSPDRGMRSMLAALESAATKSRGGPS